MGNKTTEYRKRRLLSLQETIRAYERRIMDLESKLELARHDVHYYKELSQRRIAELKPRKRIK